MSKEGKKISFKPVSRFNAKTIALSVLLGGTPACTLSGTNTNNEFSSNRIELLESASSGEKLDYSILDVSFEREASNMKNPVGVVSAHGYYGSNQMSSFHAENIVLYGLLNPQYQELAKQFMRPGYDEALTSFQKEVANNGVNAYRLGNLAQRRVKFFIKKGADFNRLHEKLGLNETATFLGLQRDYALDIYANLMSKPLKDMEKYLPQDAKLQDVDPMIIGMWMATGIATGNLNGVADLTKNKTLAEINSETYIDNMSVRFPSVFKNRSGQKSVLYAKQNLGKGHSDITIKEVSLLSNNPQIYDDYIKKAASIEEKRIVIETLNLEAISPIQPEFPDVKLQPVILPRPVLQKMKKIKNGRG